MTTRSAHLPIAREAAFRLSSVLHRREQAHAAGEPLFQSAGALDLAAAYRIQDELVGLRLARGERAIGLKLSVTAVAARRELGLDSPVTGVLTDAMALEDGAIVPLGELIHPRMEPEIVFAMGDPLMGPNVTATAALRAVDRVHAGLEILDSRYLDYRGTVADVVADNASAARHLISPHGVSLAEMDLSSETVTLTIDGRTVVSAHSEADLGEALAAAANSLAARGGFIPAHSMVLTGGMTNSLPVAGGRQVVAHFDTLGAVGVIG